MGFRTSLPVPTCAQHVDWDLADHMWAETCTRLSLENVHIIQGLSQVRNQEEEVLGGSLWSSQGTVHQTHIFRLELSLLAAPIYRVLLLAGLA